MAMCLAIMAGGFFNGKKDKPLISMIIAIAAVLIAAGFIGPYLGGVLYTHTGSYALTFSCFIPFGILAIIFALIMGRRQRA